MNGNDSAAASSADAAATASALPRVVIVGAGQTGRELARQLAGERKVVVLDTDPVKLDRLRSESDGANIETLARDGTSALALKEAAGGNAEWVIAATDQDSVNIEVCRVAAELRPRPSSIGTLRESHRAGMLRATGAESIARPVMIANQIRNRIERSHQVATSLGFGRGEIREIQVLPTSPAVNVRLRDLGARKWLVAGIYREDRFVVPHGDALIRAGDRLLITGEPEVAPGAAEFLREGKSLFPLQFGSHIVVFAEQSLPDLAWREAEYLFRTSRARHFRIVAPEGIGPPENFGLRPSECARAEPGDDPFDAARPDAGCVVIGRGEPSLAARIGLNTARFLTTMARFSCPVLIPGGNFPWERLVIPITDMRCTLRAADTAIGLARQFRIPLAALLVTPPAFIGGGLDRKGDTEAVLPAIDRMAELYRTRVPVIRAEGNPPRQLARLTEPRDLIVLGYDPSHTGSFFRPEAAVHMMIRARASVLALPVPGHQRPEDE